MRVFVPISGNRVFNDLARNHPERLGHIISPSYYIRPKHGISFVLDNGAFGCWKQGTQFDELAWRKTIDKIVDSGICPEWCVIPDVVCNKQRTLEFWYKYSTLTPEWPKAFVLQDGMDMQDIPEADVYFVGGSNAFKWSTARFWCMHLKRVHIGRVRHRKLHYCESIGAESCDGSGWLRETVLGRPFKQLEAWVLKCNHQYEMAL